VLDTIKRAEDGSGLILRFYEAEGARGWVRLSLMVKPESACLCNLMEEDEAALPVEGNEIHFMIKPYEIVTLRLRLPS